MSDDFTNGPSTNTDSINSRRADGSWRNSKRIALLIRILNGVGLAGIVAFLAVQAYGYRLRGALRVAPFKTDTGTFQTSTPTNPAFYPQATLNADNRMITVSGFYACLPNEGEAVVHAIV